MNLTGGLRIETNVQWRSVLHKIGLLFFLALIAVGSAQANDQLSPNGTPFNIPPTTALTGKAATLESVRWQQSDIPVCWESFAVEDANKRQIVREAVAKAWETVSGARFTGWGQCGPGEEAVRIGIGPKEWPRAVVGKGALGSRVSVWLNFNLAQHPGFTGCRTIETRCLQFTAVHEFGHVLGLIHEQNRPDTPQECLQKLGTGAPASQQPAPGLVLLTAYDANSVMNYCSSDGWDSRKPLALSADDVRAIQILFPPPLPVRPTSVAVVSSTVVTSTPATNPQADAGDQARRPARPAIEPRAADPEADDRESGLPPGVSAEQQEEARRLRLPVPVPD